MKLRIWTIKDNIRSFMVVEAIKGRWKTKEYILTTQGKIKREYITDMEIIDEAPKG
jgi:hypothetical protein